MQAEDKSGTPLKPGDTVEVYVNGELHHLKVQSIESLHGLAHVVGHLVTSISTPAGAARKLVSDQRSAISDQQRAISRRPTQPPPRPRKEARHDHLRI